MQHLMLSVANKQNTERGWNYITAKRADAEEVINAMNEWRGTGWQTKTP